MKETRVQSLGWEDPLEKGMATHSSICAWRIPRADEPGGLQSMGSQRVRHDWVTNTSTVFQVILVDILGEGSNTFIEYSPTSFNIYSINYYYNGYKC